MNSKFQVPTPDKRVQEILDYAGYNNDLQGKRLLENSCGEGNFLIRIVERYIRDCKKKNMSTDIIKDGLEKDIVAYDTDVERVKICKSRLDEITKRYNVSTVKWNVTVRDFLNETSQQGFDFIIGNPPYCTYHDLTKEDRDYLKENYVTCHFGRYDYFYAFVEKSISMLNDGGKLFYLVPFSLFRNKSAQKLRKMLLGQLTQIVDYSGINLFENVTVTSTLIGYEKGTNFKEFVYFKPSEKKQKKIEKELLGDLWIFNAAMGKGARFGDYFSVKNSVATLCNEAFLVTIIKEDDYYVYTDQGEALERKLIKRAISVRSAKKDNNKDIRIIYPYKSECGEIRHYENREFEKEFPNISKHLKRYENKLQKRAVAVGAKWFEYGRSQGLKHIGQKNLIMPMIVTNNVRLIETDEDVVPYAGYVITAIANYDLDVARKILKSADFIKYIRDHGTPTNSISYRVSVKEIEDFTFDPELFMALP